MSPNKKYSGNLGFVKTQFLLKDGDSKIQKFQHSVNRNLILWKFQNENDYQ